MTNEEIKTLADGYYAGNADWLNKEQEQDTKVGWRQGFAYALRQFAVIGRSEQLVCPECNSDQVIEFFPTHNKRTCFECKHERAK